MKAILAFAIILIASASHANADDTYKSAVADCLTTGAALSIGFVELNPLGPVLACGLKPLLIESVKDQPEPQRTAGLTALEAGWTGAAVNNLTLILAKLLGTSAGPAAPLIGLVAAYHVWRKTEDERELARQCAIHERLAGHKIVCDFVK